MSWFDPPAARGASRDAIPAQVLVIAKEPIPGRVKTGANGIITAPATDEAFMREYIKEWKRLMKASPNLVVQREP